jgi:hypothetical protein
MVARSERVGPGKQGYRKMAQRAVWEANAYPASTTAGSPLLFHIGSYSGRPGRAAVASAEPKAAHGCGSARISCSFPALGATCLRNASRSISLLGFSAVTNTLAWPTCRR